MALGLSILGATPEVSEQAYAMKPWYAIPPVIVCRPAPASSTSSNVSTNEYFGNHEGVKNSLPVAPYFFLGLVSTLGAISVFGAMSYFARKS